MGELIVSTFVTVDGVMQAPGGPDEDTDGGFEHGGWLVPYFDEDLGRQMVEWTQASAAVLFGRRSYEILGAYWPGVGDDDPIAAKLNRVPKYVASRTLTELHWHNSHLLGGDAAEAVAALKGEIDGEIGVIGSGDLVQTLMAHDLVDEYRLVVFPVTLGTGKRLFGPGTRPGALRSTATRTTPSGVTILVLRRAGGLRYGEM